MVVPHVGKKAKTFLFHKNEHICHLIGIGSVTIPGAGHEYG